MSNAIAEKRENPKLRRIIDDTLGQDEAIQITASGVKEHFLLVTNQRVAIIRDNVRVWGANETKMDTRNFLLRDIIRVEVHTKGNECDLELILRKKDDTADSSVQLARSIPFDNLDSKDVVKLALEIEEKIKQFSDYKPTGIPPMAQTDQIANILDQALLKSVIKRDSDFP